MSLKRISLVVLILGSAAFGQTAPDVHVPPDIGAAYGRLGKAIMTHDTAGVKAIWAEDFAVNAPNNQVLSRDQVVAAMEKDFLDYQDFHKHITYVGEKPEVTVIMGYDTMVPKNGPGAGKQVVRPFTDVWAKRSGGWQLVARQATIAAID